jgi:cytochrome c-type biogenesis protein CcmE
MVYSRLGSGRRNMTARTKFIMGGIIIVGALAWLSYTSFQENKAYYITADEYKSMKEKLDGKTFKLAGDVVAGSIDRTKPEMEFVMGSPNTKIRVRYAGKDIIPDTFKDGSQAVVEGIVTPDGVFQARHIEAKCASKYEAEYEKRSAS